MSDCPETDEELWREHTESCPGAIASGEQTAWQARNFSAKSFVYVSNLLGIREFTYEEVRARYEKLPVIDCTDPENGEPLTIEEADRRVELVREARDAGVPPPPHTVLEWNGW